MDEREIEAVAEVLAWEFGISERPSQRIIDASAKAVAALDRVRDARGDDECGCVCHIGIHGPYTAEMCDCPTCPARSPQDEDHEAGEQRASIAWCGRCGNVSVDGINFTRVEGGLECAGCGAVSPHFEYRRVSPSRVGSVAEDHEAGRYFDWVLHASDEEVGPACMNVAVPPTIANDHDFREAYTQGFRHALADVRAYLSRSAPSRVGSVAVEDVVKRIVARIRKGAPCDSDARHLIFEAMADAIEREFSHSSTDRPEQPEPDVLGGQPPAEPE